MVPLSLQRTIARNSKADEAGSRNEAGSRIDLSH
jgi:hypothetical protein